jgi:hypothetical protein
MYIYKTVNTDTGEYYFGVSMQSVSKFSDQYNIDPMGMFQTKVSNGYGAQNVTVCTKRLQYHTEDENALNDMISMIAKKCESDSKFLGIKFPAASLNNTTDLAPSAASHDAHVTNKITSESSAEIEPARAETDLWTNSTRAKNSKRTNNDSSLTI